MRCWKQGSILKALALCILLASSASHSGSAERYQLNVESQTLEQALRSLANASGRQLLFPYDQMEALKSISISGRYTLEEALGIILKDTSLSGELTTEGVILVTPIQKKSDRGSEMNSKKKILAATIGLFMGGAGAVYWRKRRVVVRSWIGCWRRWWLRRRSVSKTYRMCRLVF